MRLTRPADAQYPVRVSDAFTQTDLHSLFDRYGFSEEVRSMIEEERLLPIGVLARLQATYPQHSGLKETRPFLFNNAHVYEGVEGFRQVCAILSEHGIRLDRLVERELFIEVYRFKATRHILNTINWDRYEQDPMYQLVMPQPGMMRGEIVDQYAAATTKAERQALIEDYMAKTNPHDGHQLLNKPWIEQEDGGIELVEGSQHKYPQCMLVFDLSTQTCFSFCTYCFRHAQVRGDDDMFIQKDIAQIHDYMKIHPEITDLLITGGDAGYLPVNRLRDYVQPIIDDPGLLHIRTVRIASRMLTFQPERVLSHKFDPILQIFDALHDNGIQVSWMAHFSTPRELLNPVTLAAIRRLQRHGVVVRSQSPIMNHVSLFTGDDGRVDIERTAQNWIDLAHVLAALCVRFHSMYCARATGEHHWFTAPLADIEKVSNLIYRSLASLHRPSRYITMTTSAGKLSILGECQVNGRKALALKYNESRNMKWMDRVFLAEYDENETRVDRLRPLDGGEFFYAGELREIEQQLESIHSRRGGAYEAHGEPHHD